MKLLDYAMSRFVRAGTLRIFDADGRLHTYAGSPGPRVTIRLKDRKLYTSLAVNPQMSAGEAYVDGTLAIEEGTLRDLLNLYLANRGNMPRLPGQRLLRRVVKTIRKPFRRNTAMKSRRNVAHHYDISNELYSLFLDDDLNYSCAYYRSPDDTLETAQRNKLRHIAAKLDLKPGQRVLDIGCGWGSLAMYLAEAADVDVTGVTLSVEQQALATSRAAGRGLAGRVRFELIDYRAVTGTFDRIVSVGMFEHVGPPHYRVFFKKCRDLLCDDGVMLLHTIGRMGWPGTTDAWASKYIFPGGYAPALSEITDGAERQNLIQTDCETWRLHYAYTLRHWYARVMEKRAEIEAIYDARFFRMWQFYLAGCTSAFEHGVLCVYQLQYAKDRRVLPLTRDYMAAAEAKLRGNA